MLVLSRKVNEQLLIGDEITVTVLRIGPTAVRLGIDAPNGYRILRMEIMERADYDPAWAPITEDAE